MIWTLVEPILRGVHPPQLMMHIASYSLVISTKFINFSLFPQNLYISPYFRKMHVYWLNFRCFCFPLFWPCFTLRPTGHPCPVQRNGFEEYHSIKVYWKPNRVEDAIW